MVFSFGVNYINGIFYSIFTFFFFFILTSSYHVRCFSKIKQLSVEWAPKAKSLKKSSMLFQSGLLKHPLSEGFGGLRD